MDVLAGQGTAAIEMLRQMGKMKKKIDAVVVPVGGGGLLASMVTVFKELQPDVKIFVSRIDG